MSNPFLPTLTEDDLLGDLVQFVQGVVYVAEPADVPVVRGLVNRTAMPLPTPGFVAVSPGRMRRLSTNTRAYGADLPGGVFEFSEQGGLPFGNGTFYYPGRLGTEVLTQSVEYEAALDCYGPSSGDWAVALTTLLRSGYGVAHMTVGTPLHADDPQQMPLVSGEEQYEERWRLRVLLQYKPASIIPAQFATTIAPGVTIYPPAR